MKERDRKTTARANAKNQLEAKLKATAKRATQGMKDRLTKLKAAHNKLLREKAAVHDMRMHEYGKNPGKGMGKDQAVVDMVDHFDT